MIIQPLNPIGSCFLAVTRIMCHPGSFPEDLIACHAVCIGIGGEWEGRIIAHAWIEFVNIHGICVAYDPIYGSYHSFQPYRDSLKVKYLRKYTRKQFLKNWEKSGTAGPWDKKIWDMTPI